MVLASALSHLCKMDNIARYITRGSGIKKPVTGCEFIHLWEEDCQLGAKKVSERGDRYHAPKTPYINGRAPPKAKDNFGCA